VSGSLRWRSGWRGDDVTPPARDRVTVDLRGLGQRVRSQAAAQRLTAGAFVRRAILSQLQDGALGAESGMPEPIEPIAKVTLRLSAAHAVLLATRARRADVSQGTYIAGLIEGTPPAPRPPDWGPAVAALIASTDKLAVLSTDINGFLRVLPSGRPERLEPYRRSVMSLPDDVRKHLVMAAALLKDLRAARPTHKRR
jgi:hypothetical protein